jgi:phosphoadenosine phosphosulfate reductase
MTPFNLDAFTQANTEDAAQKIIHNALKEFDNIAISFSGAEDVVLIDMAVKAKKNIQVFSLDTGRLHPETYRFMEEVRKHYNLKIEILSPEREALEAFTREKGLFSFFED